MTTIIEKLSQLDSLEKELLGEKHMAPFYKNRTNEPKESDYINPTRKRTESIYLNVTGESQDGSQVMSNKELIGHLSKGGKLYVECGVIHIEVRPEQEYETDKQYNSRLKMERRYYQSVLKNWEPVREYNNKIQALETKIADLTTEIERELENPEMVEVVNQYIESLNHA